VTDTLTSSEAAASKPRASGPLAGIRIVEFAGLGPGPFASMMLADMGADVVTLMRGEQKQGLRGAIMMRGRRQIACDLKGVMWSYTDWAEQLAPDQREALEMIQVKIARIINGDPNYADNWRDIEGYARLVANRLEEKA